MTQDREFETYIQGKSDLSNAYAELPQVEVPDHLDAAILAEAHRAVGARPGGKPRKRWMFPLSMVASVFAVVMVGLQLPHLIKGSAVPQAPSEERRLPKEEGVPVAAPVASMDKSMAEPSAAPAPVLGKAESVARLKEADTRVAAKPAPAAVSGQLSVDLVAPASPAAAPPSPAVAAKQEQLRERAEFESDRALSKERKSAGRAEGYISNRLDQPAPAAAAMAAPEPAQQARESTETLKDEAIGANLRPEDWLIRIKQLNQQGKLEEARKELAAFKKRYPDYAVPKGLEIR